MNLELMLRRKKEFHEKLIFILLLMKNKEGLIIVLRILQKI